MPRLENKRCAGMYKIGVIAPFKAPTIRTIGHIPYIYTLSGKPRTCHKMVTKIPPDTTVAKNPDRIGVKSKPPILRNFMDNMARVTRAAVKAPPGSDNKLPYGNADLDVNTLMRAATRPIPKV